MHLLLITILSPWIMSQVCARKFVCPEKDIIETQCRGPKDCLYHNSPECNTFIHCTVNSDGKTGKPTVHPCPAGLKWNDRSKQCDMPANSTCGEETEDDAVTESQPPSNGTLDDDFDCIEAEEDFGCEGSTSIGIDCVFVDPTTNKSYIQCIDQIAYTVPCESGTTYSDTIKVCE
ncbi:hypothetical protein PEX1_031630 [Penicillium expansum]|nr:hypothetical protein PEX1_031630 [Penicillium expansum]